MRAPISIVIPTLNAGPDLSLALGSLGEGLEAGIIREVVISDGGSSDATGALAEEAGAHLVTGPAGRGGQLRRGAKAATGPWLLFLHADTELSPGWARVALAHIKSDSAGYFRLGFRAAGVMPTFVAAWANFRARMFGLPYGDQGLLIPRALYESVGGFPDQPLMEDVALARALRGHMRAMDATARTSAAKYQENGWLRCGARNLWTLARYLLGADPADLAQTYERR